MTKEISDVHLEKNNHRSVYTPPESKVNNSRSKIINKTAAAFVFISSVPIAYAGIHNYYVATSERTNALHEQGIFKPTFDEHHDAVAIDRTCQKKSQDKLFIAKEKPHCDQAQRTIFKFDAHTTVGAEMPLLLLSYVGAGAAGIVGWNKFFSKEQPTLPQKRTSPEVAPKTIHPQQTTQEILAASIARRGLNNGPVTQPDKRWRQHTNTRTNEWDSRAKRSH